MTKNNFKGYANSFQTVINLSLERITHMLNVLSNPHHALRFIHIAGTNGKGSVAAFLQAILTKAGYKTGKYISPNMLKVNERISVNGTDISDLDLNIMLEKIENAANITEKALGQMPSQFEIWTACAFCWFLEQKCDYVVLETGLGGTYDATNVIPQSEISVITRIAEDHMAYLGDTLEKIAYEKAGIIKENSVTVTSNTDDCILAVLKEKADMMHCRFIKTSPAVSKGFNDIYEIFDYGDMKNLTVNLGGMHQTENAVCAIETALALNIDRSAIREGLTCAVNPGRFEKLTENVIYDGAHNPNASEALVKNLNRYFPNKKIIFIMASMADKDITQSLNILKTTNAEFKFVPVNNNERAAAPEKLVKIAQHCGIKSTAYSSLTDAYKAASSEGKLIVICGSLYLYKDVFDFQILKNSI